MIRAAGARRIVPRVMSVLFVLGFGGLGWSLSDSVPVGVAFAAASVLLLRARRV